MTDTTVSAEILTLSDSAIKKITKILQAEPEDTFFRVAVNGGGCSGFMYEFKTDTHLNTDDIKIPCGDFTVAVDDVSVPFLKGSILDYEIAPIGSAFKLVNPNAASGCGCGVSFAVK